MPGNKFFGEKWGTQANWQAPLDNSNQDVYLGVENAQAPFSRAWLPLVLATWTATLVPLWAGSFTPTTPDNPPFGSRPWLGGVVRSWEPEQPSRQRQRFVPQGSVAAAAQTPYSRTWLNGVLGAWQQEQQQAQRRLGQIVSVDNPPFASRRNPPALAWDAPTWSAQAREPLLVIVNDDPPFASRRPPAVLAWDQPTWNAQARIPAPQTLVAAVNDPPFASRKAPAALAWEAATWNAQTRTPLVVLVNDDPPFAARRLPPALAWDAPWWNAQARPVTPQTPAAAANDPPFGSRPWLNGAIASWTQEWPAWQRQRFVAQGAVAQADSPPFGLRPWATTVRDAWEPAAYKPQVLTHVVQAAFADQPPGPDSWIASVLEQWQPAWPRTQEKRYVIQGVVVNNPPFGAKPWINEVVTFWQPVPPAVVVYRHYTAENPLTPGVFPTSSPVHFRASPMTRRLGESTEALKTARLGEPTESPEAERLGSDDTTPPGRGLGS